MMIRRVIAGLAATAVLLAGLIVIPSPAQAAVRTPSGATADTTLVCMRMQGAYAIGTESNGFHYARQYVYNTRSQTGSWGGWVHPSEFGSRGFGLPTWGQIAVYMQYAQWNGNSWEFAGEWGKVYNRRGEHVSWYC